MGKASQSRVLWSRWLVVAIASALAVAACSGGDGVTIAQGDVDNSEVEATATQEDVEVATTVEAEPIADTSYSDEGIHQILEGSCAACHAAGGPGSASMELNTAADATTYALDIAVQTAAEAMPPWPASDASVAFLNDHSLAPEAVEAIGRWADSGGVVDIDPETPIISTNPLRVIEDPDVVLTSFAGAYQGSTDVVDDYRCLIYDPELTEPEWLLATHFVPDQVAVVHHGIITLDSAGLRDQAEAKDAAEPGPGWTCYGGTGLSPPPGEYEFGISGWAPGAQPSRQPEGYAIPMQPGDFIIVQIHYHFGDESPPDLSQFALDFASDEELEAVGGTFKTLRSALYLGPAEIPCYEGDTNPLCDRATALARVNELYGGFVGAFSDFFLAQCGSTPSDYAEMTNGDAWSTCDLPVQNVGRIVSVTGHMHELGQSIRLTLNPGEPDELVLLDIPNWNFEWQFGYSPVDEIILERGDTIRVECAWNRDRAPYEAEGYILWADGTGDEMCFSSITTAPPE